MSENKHRAQHINFHDIIFPIFQLPCFHRPLFAMYLCYLHAMQHNDLANKPLFFRLLQFHPYRYIQCKISKKHRYVYREKYTLCEISIPTSKSNFMSNMPPEIRHDCLPTHAMRVTHWSTLNMWWNTGLTVHMHWVGHTPIVTRCDNYLAIRMHAVRVTHSHLVNMQTSITLNIC